MLFLPMLAIVASVGCTATHQAVEVAESEKAILADPESIVTAALMDLLKQPLKIRVSSSRDDHAWLLISGSTENPDGGELDYADTRFQSAIDNGAFESNFVALLASIDNTTAYRLVELSFGATDSPLADWQARYSLSEELVHRGRESESLQWQ